MKTELTELEKYIVHLNIAYREGHPEVEDWEYDEFIERLKSQQPGSELLKRAVIESAPSSDRKEKLPVSMMSLNKIKTIESLEEWLNQWSDKAVSFVITPKLDGLSVEKTEDERNRAWTRGDGFIGQECNRHCKSFTTQLKESHIRRGEMIITNSSWNENLIFRKYKNPRNTVGGWLIGDYKEEVPYEKMSYVCYDLFLPGKDLSKREQLSILNNTCVSRDGEIPFFFFERDKINRELLLKIFSQWKEKFPMDGLVIEVNECEFRVGTESNGNPSYAIAYKDIAFSEVAETVITKIHRNINRFGVITPVIEFNPINISGATLSRVNGINMSYVYDWGLYPEEKIQVVRSGEVIPKIVKVGSVEIPFIENYPTQKEYDEAYSQAFSLRESELNRLFDSKILDSFVECPFCGHQLMWDSTLVNQRCTYLECPERKLQGIVDFFRIIEVEDIAEGTFRFLYNLGYTTINSLFELQIQDLLQIGGFAPVSAEKFVKELIRIKTIGLPAARLMHASGLFPNLGEKTLQLILDNIFQDGVFQGCTMQSLSAIKGVAEITALTFLSGFPKWIDNRQGSYIKISYQDMPKKAKVEGVLTGKRFCFTGCRPSEDLRKEIEGGGGEVVDSVSSKTTHLVVKDLGSTSSKLVSAKKLGIYIIELSTLSTYLEQYS